MSYSGVLKDQLDTEGIAVVAAAAAEGQSAVVLEKDW